MSTEELMQIWVCVYLTLLLHTFIQERLIIILVVRKSEINNNRPRLKIKEDEIWGT